MCYLFMCFFWLLEEAMKQSHADLLVVCSEMDGDGSGCLTFEELMDGFTTNESFSDEMKLMDVRLWSPGQPQKRK